MWIHLTQIWHVDCQPIFYIFLPDFSSFCWTYVLAFHPLLIDPMTWPYTVLYLQLEVYLWPEFPDLPPWMEQIFLSEREVCRWKKLTNPWVSTPLVQLELHHYLLVLKVVSRCQQVLLGYLNKLFCLVVTV